MKAFKDGRRRRMRSCGISATILGLAALLPLVASGQSPTIVELPIDTVPEQSARIYDITADGSTAVGAMVVSTPVGARWQAMKWDASGARTALTELGVSSDGNRSSAAHAISDDGSSVAGYAQKFIGSSNVGVYAVRWDASNAVEAMQSFEPDQSGRVRALAMHLSRNGSRMAGHADRNAQFTGRPLGQDAAVWNSDGSAVAMTNLGGVTGINGGYDLGGFADVTAIAFDGNVIAGYWNKYLPISPRSSLGVRPVKWASDGTPTELPTLGQSSSGFAHAEIRALSKYGEFAFGFSKKYDVLGADLGQVPVWWDALTGVHEIVVPGTNGVALGCSETGDAAFGTYADLNGTSRSFLWTEADDAVDLGALNGTGLCLARYSSTDGDTIVGKSTAVDTRGGAFIWREGQMTSLWNVLVDFHQLDPASVGWQRFDDALFCSADGSVIVGVGTKTNGASTYFRVTLPSNEPPTIESDLVADQTYEVPLGSTFTASFDGDDEDGDDLTLEATGLPASAVLTPSAGSVSPAPAEASLTFEPTVADVGTHAVTITFRDEAGVTASIAFTLDVPANAIPTLTTPSPVVVECEGEQNLVTLSTTVDDADAGHSLTVTWRVDGVVEQTDSSVLPGAPVEFEFDYPHGESVVAVEVTDGYDEASASSAVTVEDTTDPLIVVAGDIAIPTDEGEDFATNVVLPIPQVHDVCDEEPTLTNDAPAVYPYGDTIVTWTAIDEFGNVGTVTQKVTVGDVEPPSIVGGVDMTVPVDQGEIYATVVLPEPEAIDNVDSDVTVTSDEPATFPIGQTLVTWTAIDDAGNSATWSLTVTVVNQAPVADAGGNLSLVSVTSAGLEVELDGSASLDADDHDLTFAWSATGIAFDDPTSATPSATFPIGQTAVTLTVTDEAGAQSTANITITVVYQPRRVVDTRQYGDETSFYVDETNRLVNEYHAAMGYPTSPDWTWAIHYCYWSKHYDDLAESVTYEGPEDYPTQLALYKSYRNPQVGCSQLLVTHFSRCSVTAGGWTKYGYVAPHPLYPQYYAARQASIFARDYGTADYYQP